MERRHEEELQARLERAYLDGYAFVTWNELYFWYDVQKIAARTWRDLLERWDEVTNGEKIPLWVLNGPGGLHLIAGQTYSEHKLQKLADMAGVE